MVDTQRKLPKDCKPLSNTEVIKIIRRHHARKASEDAATNFMIGNEQGNELRQQTEDYINLFNEFELEEQIKDIRK